MVESAQDGCSGDPSPRLAYGPGAVLDEVIGDLLPDALMWSGAIIVMDILLNDAMQLFAMQNEHVIQTLSSQTTYEPLTEGISSGSSHWCFQNLDAAGDSCKVRTKFVVPVTDQVLWPIFPGCGFAQLLGSPFVGGRSGDGGMHDATGLQFDDHKDVQWTEEQIVNNSEVTSPDVPGVVLQEGAPGLTSFLPCDGHVLLDRALADLDPQLEQFSADAFCAPQKVISGYLLDELDGFWRDARLPLLGFRFAPPVDAEEVAVPAQQGVWLHNV